MDIPDEHKNRRIFHFTHIDNLESLLSTGLRSNNDPKFPTCDSRSIAATSIQARRATMQVPCGAGGVVHDYVPFYFGSLSPMLLGVINKKNIDQCDILYFEFPISLLSTPGSVFTDASANTGHSPQFFDEGDGLQHLNWQEIDSLRWGSKSEDLRHQRMAEALIPSPVFLHQAERVIVWNQEIKSKVKDIVAQNKIPSFPEVSFEIPARRHYFVKFLNDEKNETLVVGPRKIHETYLRAVEKILAFQTESTSFKFKNPRRLLEALRNSFDSIPHTNELIGLQSENGVHKHTVDVHTKDVVEKLRDSERFGRLTEVSQHRVELAAYLHDIGKGPKSRWAWNNGLQKVDPDHPVRAMPMLVKIFNNYIEKASAETVRVVLKLVCYHDLVGDIIGRGRDVCQLIHIADSQEELDMLFAIAQADVQSLVEDWWDESAADEVYEKCLTAIHDRNNR